MEKVAILPMPLYETNSGSLYSLLGLVEFLKNHDILSYTLFKTMNVSKEQKEFINRNFDCLSIEDISSKNDVLACIVGPEHIWHYDYTYKTLLQQEHCYQFVFAAHRYGYLPLLSSRYLLPKPSLLS